MTQSSTLGAIPTGTGGQVRADINAGFVALATESEGASAPSPVWPHMLWRDEAAKLLRRRDAGNAAWLIIENYGGADNPMATDDAADGYVRGATWINAAADRVWVCADPAAGAAVWLEIGGAPAAHTHDAAGIASGTLDQARLPATADTNARLAVSKDGVAVGTRRRLNLIAGANVMLTTADDGANEEVDVTIATAGGAGGPVALADLTNLAAYWDTRLASDPSATVQSLLDVADAAAARSAVAAAGTGVSNTFTAGQTVQSSDSGAGAGPTFTIDRASASPAANDLLGAIAFLARSSTTVTRTVVNLAARLLDPTDGSEDAELSLQTIVAGALAARLTVGQGVQVGAPTGGDPGAGWINAAGGIKVNNSTLPFTKGTISAQQTWSYGGTITWAHGLGTKPTLVQVSLVCVGVEGGYSVGDSVLVNPAGDNTDLSHKLSINFDDTNINVRVIDSGGFTVGPKSSGATLTPTAANWRIVIGAWA